MVIRMSPIQHYALTQWLWTAIYNQKDTNKIDIERLKIELRSNISDKQVILLKVLNATHPHLCLAGSQNQWSPS